MCICGAVLGGSALKKVNVVALPNPRNSQPAIVAVRQPDSGIQIVGGGLLILGGGWAIAAGIVGISTMTTKIATTVRGQQKQVPSNQVVTTATASMPVADRNTYNTMPSKQPGVPSPLMSNETASGASAFQPIPSTFISAPGRNNQNLATLPIPPTRKPIKEEEFPSVDNINEVDDIEEFEEENSGALESIADDSGQVYHRQTMLETSTPSFLQSFTEASSPVTQSAKVKFKGVEIPIFDFNDLRENPDRYPHWMVIGKTGIGKTRLAEYILSLLGGEQFVITPKKKPQDWQGLKVIGYPFKFDEIEKCLAQISDQMYSRYEAVGNGEILTPINFVIDEWPLINSKTSSKITEDVKTSIWVARDSGMRMGLLAQTTRVKSLGIEGEGDILENLTQIRLGGFAKDYAGSKRSQYRTGSPQYNYWEAVLYELENQGWRCCLVDEAPARIPDLSNWSYSPVHPSKTETETPQEQPPRLSLIKPTVEADEKDQIENEDPWAV